MTESPSWMFTKALSHRQKVCRLFKRAMREVEAWQKGHGAEGFLEARYHRCIMRARFEANRDEKDPRKAQLLLADGCKQLWSHRHYKQFRFSEDPGGSAFDRYHESPDQLLDTSKWTLAEREQFPYYFNTREKRKKELLEQWKKIEKGWDEEIAAIQTEIPKEKSAVTS